MIHTKLFILFTFVWSYIFYVNFQTILTEPIWLCLLTVSAWACGSVFLEMIAELKLKWKRKD